MKGIAQLADGEGWCYFERVDVSEEEGTGRDKMVINVEVAEKPTGTFQVGAGFSSLESFIVTAQIQQQNLFGRGQTLGLNLQLSGIRQQIDQFLEIRDLGNVQFLCTLRTDLGRVAIDCLFAH